MVALRKGEAQNDVATAREVADELRTIVVAGVASGAGKTSLAEAVTGFLATSFLTAAAKITVTHGERGCPHGGKGCNVCSSLGGDFQVITKPSIVEQSGSDTARLRAAGASPVLWTIVRREMITHAWREMRAAFSSAECVVIESNTLAQAIQPTLTLMIVDPTVSRRLWKPSATSLIKTADVLIFNERGAEDKKESTLKELSNLRGSLKEMIRVEHPHEAVSATELANKLVGKI